MVIGNILIVDDESDIRNLISDGLEEEGFKTAHAWDLDSTLTQISIAAPDAILLDMWLDKHHMDGIGILKVLKKSLPYVPVIMISGHGNISTAVQAIKIGAYDFIEKPFRAEKLLIILKRALENTQLINANNLLSAAHNAPQLLGESKKINDIKKLVASLAQVSSRVMIIGESGVGKSTVARLIHYSSPKSAQPFISLDLSSKSEAQVNYELFGHGTESQGVLHKALGGTLFIEELADLSPSLQSRLLSILLQGYFLRESTNTKVTFNARLITASKYDLLETNSQWRAQFNQELYHRLSVVKIEIPPLRNRKSDIEPMVNYFLKLFSTELKLEPRRLTEDAMSIMIAYNWPGNIRQLKNSVEAMVISSCSQDSSIIDMDLIPHEVQLLFKNNMNLNPVTSSILAKPLKEAREAFEREYLQLQLERFGGNITKTAEYVGMDRAALYRKLLFLGLK